MRRAACSIIAAAVALPAPALAQQDTLVVTASRQPLPRERLPYWVQVLDEDELADAESLDAALARLPDVYVQSPGGRSGFASLFLRGADPNFTTVLLEGVPLNNPTNSRGGAVNLAAIPAGAIGRAELVAGPASTLYGSGALAGALNLLLPGPTSSPRLTLTGSAGTEGEVSGIARWQGPITAGWGASIGAIADDAGSALPGSRFRSRSLDVLLASRTDRRARVLVHVAGTRSSGFPDSSGGIEFAEIDDVERRRSDELIVAADHAVAQFGGARFALSASYSNRRDEITSPGVAPSPLSPGGVPAGVDSIRYRSATVRPTVDFPVGGWRASVGLSAQWERGQSEGYLDFGGPVPTAFELRRTTGAAFADLTGLVGPLMLDAGVRFDSIDGGKGRFTGRGGLRLPIWRSLALKVSGGTAWKAPSFYALANPFVGNPDLQPEFGRNVELGLEHAFADSGKLSLAIFRARYRNLIDFMPGEVPRLENRAVVKAEGVASALDLMVGPAVRLELSAQYVKASDPSGDGPLLHRPRWRAGGAVHWRAAEEVDVRLRYAFTDERHDFAVPVGARALEATHQASISIDWRPVPGSSVQLVADNLLGERTGDAIGYPALPRRIRLALTRRFE